MKATISCAGVLDDIRHWRSITRPELCELESTISSCFGSGDASNIARASSAKLSDSTLGRASPSTGCCTVVGTRDEELRRRYPLEPLRGHVVLRRLTEW